MLKPLLTCFSFFILTTTGFSQFSLINDFTTLDSTMANSGKYDAIIENNINDLHNKLKIVPQHDLLTLYDLSNQLYNVYKVYKYDSAYQYARNCQKIAYQLNDPKKFGYSNIILNFTLLSSGLFKETADSLGIIDVTKLNDSIKSEYYSLQARYHYDLADYAKDNYYTPTYNKIANNYLDSALDLYPPSSFSSNYYRGLKNIRSGNMIAAQVIFNKLISSKVLTDHEFALTASTLSDIFIQNGKIDSAISLLAAAAIADIKSATKETSAMFNLAQLIYKKGDVKNASKYIEYAINDAAFYGARQRKVQLITILPLIEMEKFSQVESQKKVLINYAVAITLLLVIVILLGITIYRQVAKLKHAQKIIYAANLKKQEVNQQLAERNEQLSDLNVQLSDVNTQLSEVNDKLTEANKIKEEYIGYFFNANSEFFNRIDRFKKLVEQKIIDRKLDEIKFLVNNINLRREKEDLLKNFDKAFIKLFPHFIDEFNLLFKEEDRFVLKDGEILNTDLRIFALIRMGIHDVEKIAQILEYSINTINTYKTRLKNKSTVLNEEFEKRIMNIKTR